MPIIWSGRVWLMLLAGAVSAPALARDLLEFVPRESVLVWIGRPLPEVEQGQAQPNAVQMALDLGTRIAGQPLDRNAQLWARIGEALSHLIRYSNVLTLIDSKAKPHPRHADSRMVDQLRAAAIIETRGQSEVFLRIVQKVVTEQTSQEFARLESKRVGRWSYQELTDRRLPEWCAFAWGELDGHFVLTIGQDVWPQIAAVAEGQQPALASDAWISEVRNERARAARIEIYTAAREICTRLDPLVFDRASAFFKAWEADRVERGHWAIGVEDRSIFCLAHLRIDGATVKRLYADVAYADKRIQAAIPPTARYAVFRVPVGPTLMHVIMSLYAIRTDEAQAEIREAWERAQREQGFDAERDILANLGETIVTHNDPPHPLHLPLAMTTLIEIRQNPEQVRKTLDRMCQAWQAGIDRATANGAPNLTGLRRDDDGVWYITLGPIAGPAFLVTDRFIVSSWSPLALRQYLEKAGAVVGR